MAIQDPLTKLIIGCCFRVANELGRGFLEKVYENALAHDLRKAKVNVIQQQGDRGCGTGSEGRPVASFPVYPAQVSRG